MTADELRRRTALWFSCDDQDQPELPLEPGAGRAGDVVAFLQSRARSVSGPDLWDPEDERDVPLQTVANAGAELDAGRAVGLVLAFEGILQAGVELPDVLLIGPPLALFWNSGPAWDDARRVAAFFDLLGALEQEAGIRPAFAQTPGRVEVGPDFEAVYRAWRAASG